MSDLAWFRSVFEGDVTPGGRTVEDFDAALAEHDREVRAAALAPIKTLAEKIMFDQDAEPARGAILAEIERQTSDDAVPGSA